MCALISARQVLLTSIRSRAASQGGREEAELVSCLKFFRNTLGCGVCAFGRAIWIVMLVLLLFPRCRVIKLAFTFRFITQ